MTTVRRAILSVSDKTGILALARFLTERGVEILSTGGTAKHLEEAGIPVTPIAQWTGSPEILGGRVKTLNPRVFGAILHDRYDPAHLEECMEHSIPPIDVVAVNLYPFEATIQASGVTLAEAIEQIDVGGPSMLRAAAKNHRHVIPLCSPDLYEPFMREFESGSISDDFRRRAAIEVFRTTSLYDATIAAYLESHAKQELALPPALTLGLRRVQDLRYGENPQQKAAFYRYAGASTPFEQIAGKELSYNNLIDLDAAWRVSTAFREPTCAIIKHTNPCGAARADSIAEALRLAIESDPVSAFGGIIGVNQPFDLDAARLIESMFLEVVVAPSFAPDALEALQKKKNLRLVTTRNLDPRFELRSAAGGILVQSSDIIDEQNRRVVTEIKPTPEQARALELAWILCSHVKSNAIVIARESQSVGIGAGQMSRVDAAKIAVMKSILPTQGAVAASDAFFPFRDGLDVLCDAGVTAVIQPGGSVRDEEVIAAANERGIAMVFTGQRHFRH